MEHETDKVNLDAAAIPDDAEATEAEAEVEESEVEETGEATSEAENSEEETVVEEEARIPYSRFETVHERAVKAEEELRLLKQSQQQRSQTNQPVQSYQGQLPDHWVQLYGDSEASRQAYAFEQKRLEEIEIRAAQKATEAVEKRHAEKEKREQDAVKDMENAFTDYAAKNKRQFTDTEQSSILDIMDEFTPKDKDGNYLVNPTSYFSKAVEIYELRNNKSKTQKRAVRNRVADLAGANSEGDGGSSSKDGHFMPGNWGSWEKNPLLPK